MANTYTLIASNTVGSGGTASVTFSSIPSTYTDLLVNISMRTDKAGTGGDVVSTFLNGSSSSVYDNMVLRGNGTSATSFSNSAATEIYGTRANTAGNTASTFSNQQFYIPNYTSSNYKSLSIDGVQETNATQAYAELVAGLWSVSSAITSITIDPVGTIDQYSTFYLYGIKNS